MKTPQIKLISASNKWSFPIIRTNIVIGKNRILFSKRILRYKGSTGRRGINFINHAKS